MNGQQRIGLRLLIAVLLISTALSAQTLIVPPCKPIMLDDKIAAGEWNEAKMIPLGRLARLYAKQNNGRRECTVKRSNVTRVF